MEYLAPAVYVEETSFRSKPIEGVGTSTTAYVGPTRTGPVAKDDTDTSANELELRAHFVTNFGEFERIFGGTGDLDHGGSVHCFVAHAVSAYFANGGSRLYVARTFSPRLDAGGNARDGLAKSGALGSGGPRVELLARFPGRAGDGRVTFIEKAAPATWRNMKKAPDGTLVREDGAQPPAEPAKLVGGPGPFKLPNGSELRLSVGGADHTIAFSGAAASLTGAAALAGVTFDASNDTVTVTVDGVPNVVTFTHGAATVAEILSQLNAQVKQASATLDGSNQLVLATDRIGAAASIGVAGADALNLADAQALGTGIDLDAVDAATIDALLRAGNTNVRAELEAGTNALVLVTDATGAAATLEATDLAAGNTNPPARPLLGLPTGPVTGKDGSTAKFWLKQGGVWLDATDNPITVPAADKEDVEPSGAYFLTLNAYVESNDGFTQSFEGLAYGKQHAQYIGHVMAEMPSRSSAKLENPYWLNVDAAATAFELRAALLGNSTGAEGHAVTLSGGDDGTAPTSSAYATALARLESQEDVAIVAAPASGANKIDTPAIHQELLKHVEKRRAYRIAVLDTPKDYDLAAVRQLRARIDSKYAALYYPWIEVSNPDYRVGDESTPRTLMVPPSGHICGIYARNDTQRGVHKAPANEVVLGALSFERDINFAHQEVLNPEGINALRFFAGRGFRLWGARLVSSDPEWKYVSDRRFFNYIEHSIDRGTQWVVFEPNGHQLWARLRESVGDFLYNEWRNGRLLGTEPKEAYFVRCDRSTMTQSDLDNGRLVCEIGLAILKPAEFVIFRIGQKTADARG